LFVNISCVKESLQIRLLGWIELLLLGNSMSKTVVLMLFALLVLSSLVMVGSVFAQAVPEFTVKVVAHPYDVPTTYSTDPYTGETITHEGYHVENKSIEVWIKNQPFTPYEDAEGNEVNLYYNVRVKGHFEEDWSTPITYSESDSAERIPRSSSEYTVLSLVDYYNPNATVDYQVEAIMGHFYTSYYPPGHAIAFPVTSFQVDETSGWSVTQTLTIEEVPTPSPEPAPSLEPILILGVAAIVAVFAFGIVLLYFIKRK
jgi:hypothetical protein